MLKENEPIYPTPIAGVGYSTVSALDEGNVKNFKQGLTKREYFAGLALQGLLSNNVSIDEPDKMALKSVIYADALLKKL